MRLSDQHRTLWRIDDNGTNDRLVSDSPWSDRRRAEFFAELLALGGSVAVVEPTDEGVDLDEDETERLRALGDVE